MTRDDLAAEVRDTLDHLASGRISRERAVRELVLSAGAYAAVSDLSRLAAVFDDEARHLRAEAERFAGRDHHAPITVDPSRGQADPDAYSQVVLVLAGFCESLAARLTDPAGRDGDRG